MDHLGGLCVSARGDGAAGQVVETRNFASLPRTGAGGVVVAGRPMARERGMPGDDVGATPRGRPAKAARGWPFGSGCTPMGAGGVVAAGRTAEWNHGGTEGTEKDTWIISACSVSLW